MPGLSDMLARRAPILAAYNAQSQQNQAQGPQELQQALTLSGLIEQQRLRQMQMAQAKREQEEIAAMRPIMQQTQGDPKKAIQALLQIGTPNAIEMASKLDGLLKKQQQGQAIGSGGLRLPDGTIIPPAARPDAGLKAPPSRKIVEGEIEVHQEMQPDGSWKEVGRGPRFARQVAPIINTGPRSEPMVAVVGPDGKSPILVPRGQAAGKTPWTGSPAANANKPLSPTAQKEVFDTDDAINAGTNAITVLESIVAKDPKTGKSQNDIAYEGGLAKLRTAAMGYVPVKSSGEDAAVEISNKVTGQALDQLRAVFGAMPTEGERKILLDLQGSINLKAHQREAIYKRAIAMARRRVNLNKTKSQMIRAGKYFSEGGGTDTAPAPGDDWKDL